MGRILDRTGVMRYLPDTRYLLRIVLGAGVLFSLIAIIRGTGAGSRARKQLTNFMNNPALCQSSFNFQCEHCIEHALAPVTDPALSSPGSNWVYNYNRDANKLTFTEEQCDAAFPGLFADVERAANERVGRPITLKDLDDQMTEVGSIRAMIYDGQFYIIEAREVNLPFFFERAQATLHALYRALISTPITETIPNIEFAMTIHDMTELVWPNASSRPIWAFTRKAEEPDIWLMPDFGFWSWPESHIGSVTETKMRMEEVEEGKDYEDKIPKIMWRGAVGTAPELRGALVEVAQDKPWADIIPIDWGTEQEKEVFVPMADHCRWQMLAHTEGHSFSGRLKYMQHCHSVTIAHKMQWIQPANLMMVASGPQQNFVEVERDFSDLEAKVQDILARPDKARRIAENQVKVFKERYLTPAAEACYWRKMFRQWARVGPKPEFYTIDESTGRRVWRGAQFETYALMKQVHY